MTRVERKTRWNRTRKKRKKRARKKSKGGRVRGTGQKTVYGMQG